jgi:hypothetical protein
MMRALRDAVDTLLFYVRCFGVFHHAVRQDLGPYVPYPPMVCTRCGSVWDET